MPRKAQLLLRHIVRTPIPGVQRRLCHRGMRKRPCRRASRPAPPEAQHGQRASTGKAIQSRRVPVPDVMGNATDVHPRVKAGRGIRLCRIGEKGSA